MADPDARRTALRVASAWLPVAAWMAAIFVLSSQPDTSDGLGRLRLEPRKLGHLVEYAGLGFLLARALADLGLPDRAWWSFVVAVLYAISDEIHQALVPGRTPLVADLAIDALGALVGIWLHGRLSRVALLPAAVRGLLRLDAPAHASPTEGELPPAGGSRGLGRDRDTPSPAPREEDERDEEERRDEARQTAATGEDRRLKPEHHPAQRPVGDG